MRHAIVTEVRKVICNYCHDKLSDQRCFDCKKTFAIGESITCSILGKHYCAQCTDKKQAEKLAKKQAKMLCKSNKEKVKN